MSRQNVSWNKHRDCNWSRAWANWWLWLSSCFIVKTSLAWLYHEWYRTIKQRFCSRIRTIAIKRNQSVEMNRVSRVMENVGQLHLYLYSCSVQSKVQFDGDIKSDEVVISKHLASWLELCNDIVTWAIIW